MNIEENISAFEYCLFESYSVKLFPYCSLFFLATFLGVFPLVVLADLNLLNLIVTFFLVFEDAGFGGLLL